MKEQVQFHQKILLISDNNEIIDTIGCTNLLIKSNIETLEQETFSKIIIDCPGIKDWNRLLQIKKEIKVPALYLVDEKTVQTVLNNIKADDDICYLNTPPGLFQFQVNKFCMKLLNTQDSLTGLLTRGEFNNRLKTLINRVDSENPLSYIIMDLDNFKQINDIYGHFVGDAVLTGFAHRLISHFPDNALVSRTGGNSFAVAILSTQEAAMADAELLGLSLKEKPVYKDLPVTVSTGIQTIGQPKRLDDIFEDTSKALYEAKAKGKDTVVNFSQLEHDSLQNNSHLDINHFENITKVVTERVIKKLTLNGRKILNELQQKAEVDQLTGLYNRRYFDNRLAQEFKIARAGTKKLIFALIDLDFFGKVNKEYGWLTGDEVLKKAAALITANTRSQDWVARYGGEELCVIFQDITLDDARNLMNRIREIIEKNRFTYDKNTISITISVGLSEFNSSMDSVEDLIQSASVQLLKAKEMGRNTVMG